MFICLNLNCGRTFDTPCKQYDDVGYLFHVCPYCEYDEIKDAVPCKQCSDLKPNDLEDYCKQCKENLLTDIRECIHDLVHKAMWDREFVLEILDKYLEGENA